MKTNYERQKASIIRYYQKNKQILNEYSRQNKYKNYHFNKIRMIFLNILLE